MSPQFEPQVACSDCDAVAAAVDWRCPVCGGPLEITNLPAFAADLINGEEWSLWRYAAMLPAARRFSLGEGATSLTAVQLPGLSFLAKLETLNPTGSYKDRGSVTLVNHLLAAGVTDVVEDSSGNAGASLAAYAGPSGIRARVYVSAHAAPAKKRLIAINADVVEVDGPRSAATDACHEAAVQTVYASHAWSPFFLAGQMTCAWEVWEQLGRRAPDAVLCPVGHGGLLLGFARGFAALRDAGLVDRLPRLFAVQSAACAPLVRAWENGDETPHPVEDFETVADGIVVGKPVRGREILAALRATGGGALRVNDAEIMAAQGLLARRGLLVEPTSAAPVAALAAIHETVNGDATIVIPLTGTGLKNLNGR